ncbi:MAG: ABC transporter permease, partial [Planctomycetes bacterium]|nr:ABC transporter permease [Planctomycetota bacterium]
MKAIFIIALRNLTFRPGRSVSCALGIALGLAIVMAVLIVDHNTILTQSSLRKQPFGDPDIEITPHHPDPERMLNQQTRIAACPEISDLSTLIFDAAALRSIQGKTANVKFVALDERAAAGFNAYQVERGDDLDFNGPPNVLISAKVARSLNTFPGDIVRLWLDRPVEQVCRNGEIVPKSGKGAERPPHSLDFKVQGVLANDHLGEGNTVITPLSAGIELYRPGTLLPILWWARLHPGSDVNLIRAALKDHCSVDKPRRALVGESPEERVFRNGVRVCAMLSLLLGLYIIFNSMSMSLVERIRQIGLLRAMGITKTGLTLLFLVEGFFLTLMGCVLSILLTAGIVAYMKWQGITTLGFGRPLWIVEIPWLQLAGIMALGTFFSLLGIIYPVGKACSLSVIQAIRKGTIEFEKKPFRGVGRVFFFIYVLLLPVSYFTVSPVLTGRYLQMFTLIIYVGLAVSLVVGLLLFFPTLLHYAAAGVTLPFNRFFKITGRLSRNTMSTARLRVFSTVSGLTMVFAAVFVISAVTDSLMSETVSWADENIVNTVYVRTNKPGLVSEEELCRIPGVKAVLNLSATIHYPFAVHGLSPAELIKFGSLEGRRNLYKSLQKGDWIIISSRIAKTYDLKVNDRFKLSTPLAGTKVFIIQAILDEYGFYPDDRNYAVISSEKMASYFCVSGNPGIRFSLHLEDDASCDEVCAILTDRLGERAAIISGAAKKEEYVLDLKRSFGIFNVICTLVALLSGVSILNSLVIAVVERRRETALLRVVGLTPGQLKGILAMEAFSLGSLG